MPTLTESESEDSDSSYEEPQPRRRRNAPSRGGSGRRIKQRGRPYSTSSDDFGKTSKSRGKKSYNGPKRSAASKVR